LESNSAGKGKHLPGQASTSEWLYCACALVSNKVNHAPLSQASKHPLPGAEQSLCIFALLEPAAFITHIGKISTKKPYETKKAATPAHDGPDPVKCLPRAAHVTKHAQFAWYTSLEQEVTHVTPPPGLPQLLLANGTFLGGHSANQAFCCFFLAAASPFSPI